MANLPVKNASAATAYLAATGAGTDLDPHVVQHEVAQATPDDLNCNANLQVGDADVGAGNPVPVSDNGGALTVDGTVTVQDGGSTISVDDGAGSLTVDGTVTADAGTGPWPVTDNGGSLTVDGTVTVNDGAGSLTVDGTVTVEDGGGSVTVDGSVSLAAAIPAGDNNIGNVDLASAIPAGTNNIGDVDIASAIPAGTNLIGKVNLSPATSGGLSIFRSIDLDESEEEVKASAGQLFGFFLYNLAASKVYIKFYNATTANVTVGTTTPVLTIPLDAGQGATVEFAHGIAFSTAITIAATTGVADADTGAPGANEVIANVFYT